MSVPLALRPRAAGGLCRQVLVGPNACACPLVERVRRKGATSTKNLDRLDGDGEGPINRSPEPGFNGVITGVSQIAQPTAQRAGDDIKKTPAICGAFVKRLKGLEPSTFCMASRRSSQLSYSRETREYSSGGPVAEGAEVA